ncbi:putative ankyrin repeat-containing domain-containing protein [Helianthus annuus]|nr:putative ankyrin repeat-containing domain-containing protein [Helianthus annuus]
MHTICCPRPPSDGFEESVDLKRFANSIAESSNLLCSAFTSHISVFVLFQISCTANIARSNLKTALHSCARQGHLEVVKALHQKVPGIVARADKKGQTALHMAVKGQNVEVVNALIEADNGLINMVDKQGNTALHITTRKGRTEVRIGYRVHRKMCRLGNE